MKNYHRKVRDIHLYAGLFISPFILVFSISAIILNHNFIQWQENWEEWTFSVDDVVDESVKFKLRSIAKTKIEYAKDILEQLNVKGEISNIFGDSIKLYIPVTKPGYRISIKADLLSGIAYIHSEKVSFWKKLIWLHKMPGPHNAIIRGNWTKTKFWSSLVDLSVICLLLTSVTGVILWYSFKGERYLGLIALFIGFISIVSLIVGLSV